MTDKILFKEVPIFIPKIWDSTIFKINNLKAVLVEAHNLESITKLQNQIKTYQGLFIIDPSSHMSVYKNSREKKSFKKLPYAIEPEPETFYGNSKLRNEKFVSPCIKYQLDKSSDIVIAPYLFATDISDTKFTINLTMLGESIHYLKEITESKPLFAMITLGCNVLESPQKIHNIIERYLEFDDEVDGFFIFINELNCNKTDFTQLFGLSKLVYQLSRKKHTFIKTIGGFGEVLCALGASGFVSGINTSESFSTKYLEQEPKRIRQQKKVYIPELFGYINDDEAKKINYLCKCSYCNGSLPITYEDKKNHYYYCKVDITQELSKLNEIGKINLMMKKIEVGIDFAAYCSSNFGSPFPSIHLNNWKEILKTSKTWSFTKQDEIELETLLEELGKN